MVVYKKIYIVHFCHYTWILKPKNIFSTTICSVEILRTNKTTNCEKINKYCPKLTEIIFVLTKKQTYVKNINQHPNNFNYYNMCKY